LAAGLSGPEIAEFDRYRAVVSRGFVELEVLLKKHKVK
jgi:hypothetical protein